MRILLPFVLCFVFASNVCAQADQGTQAQTQEKNKVLMQRFYEEVWDKGNFNVVEEVFAASYQPHDSSAFGRLEMEAADEQKKIAEEFRSGFENLSFKPDFMIAEGDKVAARWTLRGRPKGFLSFISADQIAASGVNVFRFSDGRVVEIWNHRDDLGISQQLGFFKVQFAFGVIIGLAISFLFWLSIKLIRRLRKKAAA